MATRRQECSICMDSFKNPKLISCHHSFCHKCLEDYVRANLRNNRFNCPLCRTSVELPKEGVSGFQSNFYIDTENGEKLACDLCGPKSIACGRCLDCEENLCQSCCHAHEKSKVSKHHKISDLGSLDLEMKGKIRQRIFCEKHPDEEIKLVCQKCNVTMCVLCKAVNHDTHSSKTVADAAVQMQDILQKTKTECREELKSLKVCLQTAEELETRINDAEQQEIQAVKHQQLQVKTLIDQDAAKLTEKLKSIYGELRKQNVAFRSYVENKATLCCKANENATKLIRQGTDIEKVQQGLILQRQLAEAKSKTKPNPPRLFPKNCFSPFPGKQSHFGSFLGTVQDSTKVDHGYYYTSCD